MSEYHPDIKSKKWHPKNLEKVDTITGEISIVKPLYVFKPQNIGERMSIDDKAISGEGFTIFSNGTTGKIAMMMESCKKEEVSAALQLFGKDLQKVKVASCDMAACYLSVCDEQLFNAKIVIDKFHVMQYVYDAVLTVRRNVKNELTELLSKSKIKTENDKIILSKLDIIRHSRYRITQSPNKWSERGKETMNQLFANHSKIQLAYNLSQEFKSWYDKGNCGKAKIERKTALQEWYKKLELSELKEFVAVIRMLKKHENEILNYFESGQTSARAERTNGKINRFISNSHGMKDKDFALYRIAKYFS